MTSQPQAHWLAGVAVPSAQSQAQGKQWREPVLVCVSAALHRRCPHQHSPTPAPGGSSRLCSLSWGPSSLAPAKKAWESALRRGSGLGRHTCQAPGKLHFYYSGCCYVQAFRFSAAIIVVCCFVSQFVNWGDCYTRCAGEKTRAPAGLGIHRGYLPGAWFAVCTPIPPFHVHAAGLPPHPPRQSSFTKYNPRGSLFPRHAGQPLVNHFPSLSPSLLISNTGTPVSGSLLGRATAEQIT